MKKNNLYDIIIVGGSFSGLLSALKISQECPDIKIALVEIRDLKKDKYQPDGKAFAISKESSKLFDSVNIWQKLKKLSGIINKIIITEKNFKRKVNFENEGDELGFVIDSYHINNFLHDEVIKNKNITLFSPQSLENIINEGDVCQIITNKSTIRGKLIIAADGRNSKVRNLLDISYNKKQYQQSAILFQISHQEKHNNIAYEHFTDSGPMAILPRSKAQESSIIWIVEHQIAQSLNKLTKDEFLHLFKLNLPVNFNNVKIMTDTISYDLSLTVSNSFYRGRVLLLGDSMHAIHPIAGQGFNLTIGDINYLAKIIKTHYNAALDVGSDILLQKFVKNRKLDIKKMIRMTDALNGVFLIKNPFFKKIRRFGLDLVEKSPKLKSFFINNAGG